MNIADAKTWYLSAVGRSGITNTQAQLNTLALHEQTTHANTHTCTHARTHAHSRTHTDTHTQHTHTRVSPTHKQPVKSSKAPTKAPKKATRSKKRGPPYSLRMPRLGITANPEPRTYRNGAPFVNGESTAKMFYNTFVNGNYSVVYNFFVFYTWNGCSNQMLLFNGKEDGEKVQRLLEYVACDIAVHEGVCVCVCVYVCVCVVCVCGL